jgi:bacteriocin biosynthesis cyclodehydratase domain-containing protein
MTRSPLVRPLLLPGLARAWRDPHTLQLGTDASRAILLDLPDPRAARLLDVLDGTRSESAVLTHGRRHGIAADDTRAVLDSLRRAGLVISAPALVPPHLPGGHHGRLAGEAAALALHARAVAGRADPMPGAGPAARAEPAARLRRRAAARVVVTGHGRLAAPIAVALACSGVGHVHADVPGVVGPLELPGGPLTDADVGQPRGAAIAAAVERAAPGAGTRPVRRGAATFVVQLAHDEPVALVAAGHAQRRQPHLGVALREGTPVIGPLVRPSRPPCLHCLDLHRRDRDPAWHLVRPHVSPGTIEPCTATTLLAAAAYASAEVLVHLDGGSPETVGATVDVTAAGRQRRRTWPPHPACGCARRRARPTA